jgi:hypothetical protein
LAWKMFQTKRVGEKWRKSKRWNLVTIKNDDLEKIFAEFKLNTKKNYLIKLLFVYLTIVYLHLLSLTIVESTESILTTYYLIIDFRELTST